MKYVTSSLLPFYNDDMWSVMLSRKSSSGADLTADGNTQKIQYDLRTSQYDASRETIVYSYSTSSIADGSTTSGSFSIKQFIQVRCLLVVMETLDNHLVVR